MIAMLKGRVEGVLSDSVILDVGGVGYRVFVNGATAGRLSSIGEEVKLYTYLQVKEDLMNLYGFLSLEDKGLFEKLISVSGVGPKAGMAILGSISGDQLRLAILSGDHKAISKAPGIGAKTAQKICLELKDKVSSTLEGEDFTLDHSELSMDQDGNGAVNEAAVALQALGYSRTEAYRALKKIPGLEDMDTEEILKAALKQL